MAFPQHFLDELSSRSDILDVVSSYVALTKKGSNYFGLCPFHNEKTGSFSVAPDKQMYHCFGCGNGFGCDWIWIILLLCCCGNGGFFC